MPTKVSHLVGWLECKGGESGSVRSNARKKGYTNSLGERAGRAGCGPWFGMQFGYVKLSFSGILSFFCWGLCESTRREFCMSRVFGLVI